MTYVRNVLESDFDFTHSRQFLDFGYCDSNNIGMDVQRIFTTFLSVTKHRIKNIGIFQKENCNPPVEDINEKFQVG